MADAPTNLMAKYYVQESSGDYSSSQFVSIFMMETSGTLEIAELCKKEGQTLSQDVDCLMGSYMPCPPWTPRLTADARFSLFYISLRKHLKVI